MCSFISWAFYVPTDSSAAKRRIKPMLQRYFYPVILAATLIAFTTHAALIQATPTALVASYVANVILAAFGFWLLKRLKTNHAEKLGFIYLALSGLKFSVYFVVLQPLFIVDSTHSSTAFTMFFIPYSITTFLETYALVRVLNQDE